MSITSTSPKIRARAQRGAPTNHGASADNSGPSGHLPDIGTNQPHPDEGNPFMAKQPSLHAHLSDVIESAEARESSETKNSGVNLGVNLGSESSLSSVSSGNQERDLEDEDEQNLHQRSAHAGAKNRSTDIRTAGASSTHFESDNGAVRARFKPSGSRPFVRERHMGHAHSPHTSDHEREISRPDSRPQVETHQPARGFTSPPAGVSRLWTPSISPRVNLSDNKQWEINTKLSELTGMSVTQVDGSPHESDLENIELRCSAVSIDPDLSELSHQSRSPELREQDNYRREQAPRSRTDKQEIQNPSASVPDSSHSVPKGRNNNLDPKYVNKNSSAFMDTGTAQFAQPVHGSKQSHHARETSTERRIKSSSTPDLDPPPQNKSPPFKTERSISLSANSQRPTNNYIGHILDKIKSETPPTRQASTRKSLIKPIPPLEYDGSPNLRAFNRFVQEGTTYVRDGDVREERHVFILSYYLAGTAYNFFEQKVSNNFTEWTLSEFFTELFNYCFPIDFRMKQQKKLEHTFQGNETVATYIHKLEELFNVLENQTQQQKVIKLWYGLRASIQKILWHAQLNPETSSWEEVVARAEIGEIVEGVSSHVNRRPYDDFSDNSESYESDVDNSVSSHEDNQSFRSHLPDRQSNNRVHPSSSRKLTRYTRDAHNWDAAHRNGSENNNRRSKVYNKQQSGSNLDDHSSDADQNNSDTDNELPQWSKEELWQLRREGRCFICTDIGHIARDCPEQYTDGHSSSEEDQDHSEEVPRTSDELQQLRREGRCFICEEIGHSARDCPEQYAASN